MTRPLSAPTMTGRPITRVEGRLKVTGKAPYAADNPISDLVYGVLVCSAVARGRMAGMNDAAALAHPDVLRVLSDFNDVKLPYDPGRVASFGQPLAIVVGTTVEAATHGASLVEVRYSDTEPSLTDVDAPEVVWEPGKSPRVADYARGDADAALRGAAVVSDLQYSIARNNHNSIELPAVVARWDGDQLTVWDKVQGVSEAVEEYSAAFGVAPEQVRVISPFVGGAFGSAGKLWPHQLLVAAAARRMRRPVKVVLTRKQFYTVVGYRPTSRQRMAIGADRSGRITAMVHEARTENSRYDGFEDNLTALARYMYSSPNMRSTYRSAALDVNPPTWMRGPGMSTGAFALESAMDDLAVRLEIDPIELRLRNEPARNETEDLPFATRRLTDCFREGAATFGWSRRNPVPRSTRDGTQLMGMGTAAASYHTVVDECTVRAHINPDGTADVQTASCDMGPGTYTSMTQVAADALGIPMGRVRFALGDSQMPRAPLHAGSRTMASVGSAVQHAGNMVRDRFIRTAVVDPGSPLIGLPPDQVSVADGRMFAVNQPGRGESYRALLGRRGWGPLGAEYTWTPDEVTHDRYSMQSFGAVFAEVAVDEALCAVRVRRMYAVYDVGRIVNPLLAHSQAIGAMVGGIGQALLEATELDHRDGRITNANLSDYLVPVNADIAQLDATFLPGEDMIADPLGVKGLGELVFVGVAAAIANAVFHATGRRITSLPITLDKLMGE